MLPLVDKILDIAKKFNSKLIYASSAATYGDGSNNFDDKEKNNYLSKLIPLNLYGWSKHLFDKFIINEKSKHSRQFGCNDYHLLTWELQNHHKIYHL